MIERMDSNEPGEVDVSFVDIEIDLETERLEKAARWALGQVRATEMVTRPTGLNKQCIYCGAEAPMPAPVRHLPGCEFVRASEAIRGLQCQN